MRKALALCGLVLVSLGLGTSALARSGSDSSGTHSFTLDCTDNVPVFVNTGSDDIQIRSFDGGTTYATATPGMFVEFGWDGWSVYFEDPDGSGNWQRFDAGTESFQDICTSDEEEPNFEWSVECGDEAGEVIFTNSESSTGYINLVQTAGVGYFLAPGESFTSDPDDTSRFPVWFLYADDAEGRRELDSGEFADCTGTTPPTTQPGGGEVPDEAPDLINECRGEDWYLVNPDVDGEDYTWAYRIGHPLGIVLYDPDYTSNNPDAVYGEVLVPAGTNEVGYADDFNVVHTNTRPAECGGPTHTTAPPTTQPSNSAPPVSVPEDPAGGVMRNVAVANGDGFVTPGADISPGIHTFGATGFAPGEQVEVTLHSTPRSLGTVTANSEGVARITAEVLASDGAGEHSVVFTGPSGTVTIPFTLVLPAQTLPQTR